MNYEFQIECVTLLTQNFKGDKSEKFISIFYFFNKPYKEGKT